MANLVGKKLGSYRLIQLLGAGGFGEVYLGEHRHNKQPVAIKILQPITSNDFSQFINEARAFRLMHPNIVPIIDFGIERNVPFIVMKYAPNGTLRQRHPRGIRLPLSLIVSYVNQISKALQYAHNQRIVHRDIKPENLLISSANEIMVSDFGIATVIQSSRSYNIQEAAGTITYMAPEQIQGRPSAASDQYALAIMVYEWLCGYPPFLGTFVEIATQHMFTVPTSLTLRIPELPQQVESVVLKALEKNPKNRFNNVQEFAEELEKASTLSIGLTILSRRVPFKEASNDTLIWSPDNKYIAFMQCKYESYTLHILDVSSQENPKVYNLHKKVNCITWLEKGLYLIYSKDGINQYGYWTNSITGDEYGRIICQNIMTGEMRSIRCHTYEYVVDSLNCSPNGRYIAAVVDYPGSINPENDYEPPHTVEVYDTDTCSFIFDFICESNMEYYDEGREANMSETHGEGVTVLSWSSDSTKLASRDESGAIRIWDVTKKSEILKYEDNCISSIAWSPDGNYIATYTSIKGEDIWAVQIKNLHNNKVTFCKGGSFRDCIDIIKWSPNGKYIAAAIHVFMDFTNTSDSKIYIFEATTGHCMYIYHERPGRIKDLSWSHNGLYIASMYEYEEKYPSNERQLVVNVWVAPQ